MKETFNNLDTTELSSYLVSHSNFLWKSRLWPTGLEYLANNLWSRNFKRSQGSVLPKFSCCFLVFPAKCLAGVSINQKFWKIVLPCFSKVKHFSLYSAYLAGTAYWPLSREEQFLAQMASFIIEIKFVWKFFDFLILLQSNLVVPGGDVSHCHEEPMLLKH